MKHDHSPLWTRHELTLELFDHYVAKAREERAQAISAFGRQVIAAASRMAARLVPRRRRLAAVPLDRADLLTR
jgi:hypothetical protein